MNEQQLQEIEQRWTQATKGPWFADMRPVATECGECGEYAYEVPGVIRRKSDGCGIVDVQESEKQNENAQAIANAPTDIAFLLAEVEMLQQQLRCEHSAFLQAKAFAESLAKKMSPWALCKACKFHEKECDSPISDGCELWEVAEND